MVPTKDLMLSTHGHTLTMVTEQLPIDTPTTYAANLWVVIRTIAWCMHTDLNVFRDQPTLLYRKLINQGQSKKGLYVTQLPKLLRIKSSSSPPNEKEVYAQFDRDFTTEPFFITGTLLVPKKCEVPDGLYTCSLTLVLTNPDWDLCKADGLLDVWELDEVFLHIPDGHSTACSAHFEIELLQYTAPLPPARISESKWSLASKWSALFPQWGAFAKEFKNTFFNEL